MLSRLLKPLNVVCLVCYLLFMGLTFNSKIADALVYISEENGKPVYLTKKKEYAAVAGQREEDRPVVAIRYSTQKASSSKETQQNANFDEESSMAGLEDNDGKELVNCEEEECTPQLVEEEEDSSNIENKQASESVAEIKTEKQPEESKVDNNPFARMKEIVIEKKDPNNTKGESGSASAKEYIDAILKSKWEYSEFLDRYKVQYDKDTYIVLTIRPSLQKMMEKILAKYNTRISVGIISDPFTGEVLAIASSHKNKVLNIENEKFKTDNWAFRSTFPVASIFKIITASAGIDSKSITSNSNFLAYKKSYMKVWKAFASSHNGVFASVAKKVGKSTINKYAEAFGFNKNFFFDLPVGKSIISLSDNRSRMGQDAAGLNKNFLISPMHVSSIVSTILNRGKTLKPYLVDYVVRKGKVVFKRRPFQIAQPIKESTAREIYKMMYATTAVGTGKKGFGGYRKCPNLAKICGGKTGTLTGDSPNYLFTWFGGFTKATGRDLCIVTLSGQKNHSGTKAASIAGQVAYELYMKRYENSEKKDKVASK